MRRSGSRRNEPETTTTLPPEQPEVPKRPSAGPVEPVEPGDQTTPAGAGEPDIDAEIAQREREAEHVDTQTGEATEERSTLQILQDGVRRLLDYDQLQEVRHALTDRREALEKHRKKGTELGVVEHDADRRLQLLIGDTTRFGLIRIFERETVTEQVDVFFDASKPNGRPDAKTEEEPEDPDAAKLAAETGTATDGEGWDQGGQDGSKEGAERVAAAAGITA